jgi:hypothetical protein
MRTGNAPGLEAPSILIASHAAEKEQNLEVRSHVLALREGELESRLRDRERSIEVLNLRLRELNCQTTRQRRSNEKTFRR